MQDAANKNQLSLFLALVKKMFSADRKNGSREHRFSTHWLPVCAALQCPLFHMLCVFKHRQHKSCAAHFLHNRTRSSQLLENKAQVRESRRKSWNPRAVLGFALLANLLSEIPPGKSSSACAGNTNVKNKEAFRTSKQLIWITQFSVGLQGL